jgi:glycosyltransferase involved in cell wall biosynthesis
MRVAYVSADQGVPVFGCKGCSVHVQEVLRVLIELGIQVELFSPRIEGSPPVGLEPIAVHELPRAIGVDRATREQAALAGNTGLREALEFHGPFDLVYERYSLWSFAGMEYAHEKMIPGVLEVNAPLIEEQAEYRGLCNRTLAERVARDVFSRATILAAVSAEVADYLLGYPGTSERVSVITNGVNPSLFRPGATAACPSPDREFTVGFVGNLRPWHGLETLVEAFVQLHQRNADVRLLIVGDGPARKALEVDLSFHGLRAKAHFTGAVSHDAIPGMLASMDVAVAPYPELPHFYFSPLKVFEYMAAGLPVVASRIGQVANVIQHEKTGLLCSPGSSADCARAVERLRDDPVLRQRLGAEARAAVLEKHTWEAVVNRILSLAGVAGRRRNYCAEPSLR